MSSTPPVAPGAEEARPQACCAHIRVAYQTEDYYATEADVAAQAPLPPGSIYAPLRVGTLLTHGYWACADCGTRFVPVPRSTPPVSGDGEPDHGQASGEFAQRYTSSGRQVGYGVRRCRGHWHVTHCGEDIALPEMGDPFPTCDAAINVANLLNRNDSAIPNPAHIDRACPLYALPPSPEPSDTEDDDMSLRDSVALEVLCRVFEDGADAGFEEWRAFYKPSDWLHWSRGLGAFIAGRLLDKRALTSDERAALDELREEMSHPDHDEGGGVWVTISMRSANAIVRAFGTRDDSSRTSLASVLDALRAGHESGQGATLSPAGCRLLLESTSKFGLQVGDQPPADQQPVAWDISLRGFDLCTTKDRENAATSAGQGLTVIPLYSTPPCKLTSEEREALDDAIATAEIEAADETAKPRFRIAGALTARGLRSIRARLLSLYPNPIEARAARVSSPEPVAPVNRRE